eukprot:TRINITY_DN29080_c0_g2_i1.p2 TRINITY_DN29080_c0_g2~~TRINITY_DN29080_c0_g2_i1.p2  ORF type:complete len:655 (-),score=123.40 TRINITY_DN29080_c0_g2_i1:25-1989(-)
MAIDFSCAVIQDIDYLPEAGVDYAACDVPTQLSSEIDRYDWKVPYLDSAGGIVGANLEHWRTINGFSNEYYGWGGEDDELHHRLKFNNLLYGDCYPFCKDSDPTKDVPGASIKRPPKGAGRFSGEFMHSANHTKRITDNTAYQHNLDLLKDLKMGSGRWKVDGLVNLQFRIVSKEVDTSDEADFGITYHHIKAHRGADDFNISDISLAVPSTLCDLAAFGSSSATTTWTTLRLGDDVPWDLPSLRKRAAAAVPGCRDQTSASSSMNFLLVDRSSHLAKVLSDADPRRLLVFYRSLESPAADGLIIADPRAVPAIEEAFSSTGSNIVPPTAHSVCASTMDDNDRKYSIHAKHRCAGGGWDEVKGCFFKAYTRPRADMQAVTFCDNPKYWTQRFVAGSSACPAAWAGLEWEPGRQFWVPNGTSYCIGTRQADEDGKQSSFSRLLPQQDCSGEGFKHVTSFGSVEDGSEVGSMTICVVQGHDGRLRLSQVPDCAPHSVKMRHRRLIATFPARAAHAMAPDDVLYCVAHSDHEDTVQQGGTCGTHEKLSFALPGPAKTRRSSDQAMRICVGYHSDAEGSRRSFAGTTAAECSEDAASGVKVSLTFSAPSAGDVAASLPMVADASSRPVPLFNLLTEETECFAFFCPGAVNIAFGGQVA